MFPIAILIVEEDPQYIRKLEKMLTEMGYYNFDTAQTIERAEAITEQRRPDLIISNIFFGQQPAGLAFAREQLKQHIPVVLITSSTNDKLYEEARSSLPAAYLVKPFDKLSLRAAIERTLIQQGNTAFIGRLIQDWHRYKMIREHIFVRHNSVQLKVKIDDIERVTADGNYSFFYVGAERYSLKSALKTTKELLSNGPFLQVNRGTLVNFNFIKEVSFSKATIKLESGTVVLGKAYRSELRSWMNRP